MLFITVFIILLGCCYRMLKTPLLSEDQHFGFWEAAAHTPQHFIDLHIETIDESTNDHLYSRETEGHTEPPTGGIWN